MKKTITVYVCDSKLCGKEIKTLADGLVWDGELYSADKSVRIRANREHEEFAMCWGHFHEKFPSPQIRDYNRRVERDGYIPRGGPDDR